MVLFDQLPYELRMAIHESVIEPPIAGSDGVYAFYRNFGLRRALQRLNSANNRCTNPIHKMSDAEIMAMLDKMER